jgi:predicted acyltransferase (DUF342 family)
MTTKNPCVKEDLIVKGTTILRGPLNIGKSVSLAGTLHILNTNDSTEINSGSVVLNGGCYIRKNLILSGDIDILGSCKIKKDSVFENNTTFFGNTTLNTVTIKDKLFCHSSLGVTGNINVNELFCKSDFTVEGTSNFKNNIIFEGNLFTSNSNASFSEINVKNTIKTFDFEAYKNVSIGGSCTIALDLSTKNFTSDTFITKKSGICNKFFCQDLTCNGKVFLKGELLSNKNATFIDCSVFNLKINSTNESHSFNTGALVCAGGIGSNGSIFTDKNLTVNENFLLNGNFVSTCLQESVSINTGAIVLNGGIGINGNIFSNGILSVKDACFLKSNVSIFGTVTISNTSESDSSHTGSLIVSGGLGVMKSVNINGEIKVTGSISCGNSGSFDK